ncbi:hypothetical protein BGZ60DRAFT_548313 [Tricladium varicosporioides]|nr:hypothetical protein BGZ60DRAFT_548313 [Hymenoscyphus varicosporioides]
MSGQLPSRPPTRRPPLGEATRRINNTQGNQVPLNQTALPHHESLRLDGLLQIHKAIPGSLLSLDHSTSPESSVINPRLSAISRHYPTTGSNRNSQISTVSTNASDPQRRLKKYIGPWKLGKDLGKGATARVRKARHAFTGQEAAIKIVQKDNAQMSQAGSLLELAGAESRDLESEDGPRRMPVGIEREVAIMKLIQHPNVMKLYDIWENRTEIYLVLEYVNNGELFELITTKGRLEEEEAIKYFRQILSAVGYCHSLNICHRDLKPENILLTKDGDIKIADFGMAALHQSPNHKLKTSCGSPHYAAPELIRGANYRGEKVDIWSLGVILYATLAGRLPFDVEGCGKEWIAPLLAKIRKGSYEMAHHFSEDAANLIWRILQVNPRDRISLSQVWRHPLIRKYDYLDNLGGGPYHQALDVKDYGSPVLRRSEISKDLLRQLRSMWHQLTEQQLLDLLLCEEPNDQKLFYSLLVKYRNTQLENYTPDLEYPSGDYHHVKPLALTKTYSTCNFSQTQIKGHGRQISKFTVISNVAETEGSYDPFKASRPQNLNINPSTEGAKVVIHRGYSQVDAPGKKSPKIRLPSRFSLAASERSKYPKLAAPRGYASRSSLASSTRSRNSVVRPAIGNRRGVSFMHIRRFSISSQNKSSPLAQHSIRTKQNSTQPERGQDEEDILGPTTPSASYIRPKKVQNAAIQPVIKGTSSSEHSSLHWTDDVRQLSTSLAKDCDEAFNRTSVVITTRDSEGSTAQRGQSAIPERGSKKSTTLSNNGTFKKLRKASLDTRPLPPPPTRSNSVKAQLLEARKQAEIRKASGGTESPGYLDRMVSHIDRLILPSSPTQPTDDSRRLSVPVITYIPSGRPLPSIHEARGEESSPRRASDSQHTSVRIRNAELKASRIASAPEAGAISRSYREDRFGRSSAQARGTIRVVAPSSPGSPVRPPAPLTIRKKASHGGPVPLMSGGLNANAIEAPNQHRGSRMGLRQQYNATTIPEVSKDSKQTDETSTEEHFVDSSTGTIVRKKSSWFRRNSKSSEDDFRASSSRSDSVQPASPDHEIVAPQLEADLTANAKHKTFSFRRLFKKRDSKPDMIVSPYDVFDDNASVQDSVVETLHPPHYTQSSHPEDPRGRQIEPQQNWLAKLFKVKPNARFICFSVSKRRARQEITTILREWKRYGIKDIQIDKQRNIVFGKVGAKNFLDMREVAFAGEIMTVVEHGKRSHLSIARFTQERGAASSFQKVVETLESVLKCRGMLVADERKKRMMIKTMSAL